MIKSVLKELIDQDVTTLGDIETAREKVINHIKASGIKTIDKMRMTLAINRIDTPSTLHSYIFNAYLKYSGMGVNNRFQHN
jgi:hypothetical protein